MPLEEVIAANRALIKRRNDRLVAVLIREYGRVLVRAEREARALAQTLASRPTPPSRSELLRLARLQALTAQVREEMRAVTTQAAGAIAEQRRVTLIAGIRDTLGAAQEVGVSLNPAAVERVVAALQPGSPLQVMVAELPQAASLAVRDALVQGVALGRNPREVARGVRQALGGQQARALTIARTEVLRAYRGAALETMRASSRNIEGWVWISARDDRTCAFCWAMHGTVHPLTESLASHPNCRCSMGPMPREAAPSIRSGLERFRELPESTQLRILGPAKHRAFQQGAIELTDLVGQRRDPRWGNVGFERSLRDVLGQRRAVAFYRREAA